MTFPTRSRAGTNALRLATGIAALAAILALAWWAYRPGLAGDFLFDDFANLPVLGATGPIDNWAAFWRYLTSGDADPTGRPLTLLTFLIDARNWPANPYPFKVTNLVLHLANGALLFWVLWWLGEVLAQAADARGPAARGAVPSPLPLSRWERGSAPDGNTGGRGSVPLPLYRRERGSASRDEAQRASNGTSRRPAHDAACLAPLLAGERGAVAPREGTDSPSEPTPCGAVPSPLPLSRWERGSAPDGDTGTTGAPADGTAMPSEPTPREAVPSPLPLSRWERGSAPAVLPRSDGRGAEGDADVAAWPAIAALFGAGAWLLHPLFVSTTLYIVQREAMLPATFVLIAMLGWIASREALRQGHLKRALVGMALSAWVCTGLAVLSKANGALLPLLLLLADWIVLSRRRMPTAILQRWQRGAVTVFLIVPSALVLAYLASLWPHSLTATVETRGWSVGERLLTEARVLTDYLRLLVIPHAHSTGLFNDQFAISTGWLHPGSTLPCVLLVLALIGAGFALRERHPAIALALLFYFAAQLMESGWIPLELYYEHRNYLPAMLLFWPVGIGLARPGALRFVRIGAGAAALVALAVLTSQRATLWGDGFRQAQVWAAINPDSARAQANAALYDMAHGRPRIAAARLRLSLARHPDDIQAPINLIGAECQLGAVRPRTLAAAEAALANTRLGGQTAFKWFDEALGLAAKHACTGLDFAALQATLDAARNNPFWRDMAGRQQDLDHLQGQLDLAEDKPDAALAAFNRALAAEPGPAVALQQAALLGSSGHPRLGLAHLDYFAKLPPGPKPSLGMPRIHAWVLRRQGWWSGELTRMRHVLATDAAAKRASAPGA